jgi:hypothetical protein
MHKLCFETKIGGFPITLHQNGIDKFTVRYGLQVKENLTYAKAATELGCAIMHGLACESKLDNREKRTRREPACYLSMGCLCAAHARGAKVSEPCNATE